MTVQFRGEVCIITVARKEFRLIPPLPQVMQNMLNEAHKADDGFATAQLTEEDKPIEWERLSSHNERPGPTTGLRRKQPQKI